LVSEREATTLFRLALFGLDLLVLLHQGKRTRPGIEYTNSTVDAIYHAEGRAVKDGSTWDHEYVITDHLGNTRVRFHDDNGNGTISSGELLSTHDYYPFGMEWNAGSYQYLFNGIEKENRLGINWYETSFREYDPTIGRWLQIDPVYKFNESGYVGFGNNPILLIDPFGTDTLKAIGGDLFGTYEFEAITVTPKNTSNSSSNSTGIRYFLSSVTENRFNNWESTGTGAGLSVNPNFPQYSAFAEGVKDISWEMLGPVLMSVAGGGVGAETGGGRELIRRTIYRIQNRIRMLRLSRIGSKNSKSLVDYWPPNNGALGDWDFEYLMPGTEIDRFGSEFGKYFSPVGTPMPMRALPSSNSGNYHAYRVNKPFHVRSSTIAPAFGKVGLGKQYLSPVSASTLRKKGIIVPIN
jgi:RHS repeat-associated protein